MLAVQNLVPLLLAASVTLASPIFKRYTGFTDPAAGGGSSIGYFPGGTSGEPLNVIISSESAIETSDGFANWYKSIGFGKECFGLHSGDAMQANLGDGRGAQNQTGELRESYGEDPDLEGSCLETFKGGESPVYSLECSSFLSDDRRPTTNSIPPCPLSIIPGNQYVTHLSSLLAFHLLDS